MHVKERDISSYIDNSLAPAKKEQLKAHFEVCKDCRRKLIIWEELFSTVEELDFDFPLVGLEQNIIREIRKQDIKITKEVTPRMLFPYLLYTAMFLFLFSVFFIPYNHIAGLSFQKIMNVIFHEGLDFINRAKWLAIDLFAYVNSMDFVTTLLMLLSSIILIVGGIYYSLIGKFSSKAT